MRTAYVSVLLVFAVTGTLLGQDKPNVVFVMPDDISHNAFSYFNSDGPRTPHIDKLAENSVRLTDFHVSPTCAPTRAALMTGRFNDVTGVWHTVFGRNQLRKDEITMADVFKHNGYATGLFFKWHLGDNYPFRPKDRGFDYVAWTKAGGVGQQPDYWGNMNTQASIWVNDKIVKMTDEDDGIEGAFTTNFFFNRAMEFMEENIQKSKPFFAYIPTATAHGPHHMPPDARSGVRAPTGTIENIDKNMGRLIQFLDDRGIADNTILIFTTDNGSSTFLRGGKGSFYDGGTRVPCFVRWPAGNLGGEGEGRDVSPLTAHIDWLPTFMDIIGLEDVPNRLGKLAIHGRSFRPFLDSDPTNDPADYKDRAVTIVNMRTEDVEKFKSLSVKKDVWEGNNIAHKWRLCRSDANARWELYDVLIDERQGNNVIRDSAHAEIVAELKQEYEEWWALVTERSEEYTRIIIGHPAEPITQLNSHDFHRKYIWNHGSVATGKEGSDFIAVEFAKPGTYRFDLRRWPKEIEDQSTLTTAPSGVVYDGKTIPRALDIASARIKIWLGETVYVDERKEAEKDSDGILFTVEDLPAGPAFIQTWFYNSSGDLEGAVYYNYAHRADEPQQRAALSDDERMAWWRDAGFGLFIHWGAYAIPGGERDGKICRGGAEWIMDKLDYTVEEYEELVATFNPVEFDADEWVSIAKDAGMKYIVITSKHHDGFCLWDSEVTDYDIIDAAPFKRDIIKELAEACRKQGLKFCFYHSIVDWHHPQAQAPLYPNYNAGQRDQSIVNPEFPKYYENYLKPQVTELLTNYGEIGVVWFDGDWIADYTTEMGKEMYAYIRKLQPNTIVNNRVDKGRMGMKGLDREGDFAGDFGTPEQEIPDTGISSDWESCMTMNGSWGYKPSDRRWKSSEVLIRNLIDVVSKGGNFLLNVGPSGEGKFPPESVERLKAMGVWTRANGESIYGVKASPYAKPAWGRYTGKPGLLYAHVFDWPDDGRLVINKEAKVEKATLLAGSQEALTIDTSDAGTVIRVPQDAPDSVATVIKIELASD